MTTNREQLEAACDATLKALHETEMMLDALKDLRGKEERKAYRVWREAVNKLTAAELEEIQAK